MNLSAKLDKVAIAKAMEDGTPEHRYLLDRETGQVLLLSSKTMSTSELLSYKDKMEKNPERYITITRTPSEEKYQDLEMFVREVKDKKLQEKLAVLLRGGNPVRAFLDLVDTHPMEKEHWRKFKTQRVLHRLEGFMKENGLG